MQLYFMPLACSMAARIALAETETPAKFTEVDALTKTIRDDGGSYLEVHSLGVVPALRTDEGQLITENVAVLSHLARRAGGKLGPVGTERERPLQQWLAFISTELHARLFSWMFDPGCPDSVKSYAAEKGASRLDYLERHLDGRSTLLDEGFSVADAYLLTVLNWAQATPVDLSRWPAVKSYYERGCQRPSVKAALAIETPLFIEERQRQREAAAS